MIKNLLLALFLASPLLAQVSPIQNPHPTFNSAAGTACAGCSLYSYAAGSTTPLATYTDSTGATQNTNPIIMGADGGPLTPSGSSGAIWMGQSAYKFVLIDTQGNTVFTVDNVQGSGGFFPCGPAYAIQIANSGVTGFTCDATITINTAAHSVNVGTLPTAHVTIGAVGTPTSWTFDTTTPASALASLGGGSVGAGTLNQIGYYAASGTAIAGTSALPSSITVTTKSPGDNSTSPASTAYVALPGAIAPTGLQIGPGVSMTGNQGTGTSVQHSTGTVTSGDCVKFDANGNTVDAGQACNNVQNLIISSGICTASGGSYSTCTDSAVSWPATFGDNNYSVACSGLGPSGSGSVAGNIFSISKTATGITLSLQVYTSGSFTFGEIDCIGKHN